MRRAIVIGLLLGATVALLGGMLRLVAEYPGVERPLGPLPPWFVGASPSAPPPATAQEDKNGEAKGPEAAYTVVRGTTVEIDEKEYELIPDRILLKVPSLPATVTFVLHNQGRFSHDFEVKGHGIDVKAPKFRPGRTEELEVTFTEAGEYEISCPLSNHRERGMEGTLVIQVGE